MHKEQQKIFLDPSIFIYDKPKDIKDYTCFLCQGVLYNALSDPCNHFFCKDCIDIHLKKSSFCPINKKVDIKGKLQDAEIIQTIINNKVIYCINEAYGCKWSGKVKGLHEHSLDCPFMVKQESKELKDRDSERTSGEKLKDVKHSLCIYDNCKDQFNDLNKHLVVNRVDHEKLLMLMIKNFKETNEDLKKRCSTIEKQIGEKKVVSFQPTIAEVKETVQEKFLGEKRKSILPTLTEEKKEGKKQELAVKRPSKKNDEDQEFFLLNSPKEKKKIDNTFIKSPTRNNPSKLSITKLILNTIDHSTSLSFFGKRVKVNIGSEEKYRFAFAENTLNFASYRWKVKIHKFKDWVGLGACFKDEIIADKYSYTKVLNHNTFIFASNGFIWNCLNHTENGDQHESMIFEEGEVIEFSYDHSKYQLNCQHKGKNYLLTKVKPKLLNFLVPCVILKDSGDEVEFIELNN